MQWAVPRNYVGPSKVLAIYWDNPDVTPPEKCRFDACIIVPDDVSASGKINIQSISGGPYGICNFEVKPDSIQKSWEAAYVWLCKSGFECGDKPCFELYNNDASGHPEGKWNLDICIPLKS
jgi:AraC family transcriptional regulator